SLIEILRACFKQVRDRLFAIAINIFCTIIVSLCLYSLHKLKETIDVYPLIYEQHMNDEYTKRAFIFYQERNCVASRTRE
ncbi:MAG TPA: hypothetical protein VIC08_00660, partial [Cellvibrionaceae bacterium]